jgi:hypothetical protein
MRLLCAALAVTVASAVPAQATDVHELLAAPQKRVKAADFRAIGHLVKVDANGGRSSDAVTIEAHWFPGVLRVLVEIAAPAEARARILLEMRPDGQTTIRMAHPGDKTLTAVPFAKWGDGPQGSGFSYEDFLEPQYFWPGQKALAPTRFGARDCDVLKSTPGAEGRTHYAEIRSWLDHDIGFPVYVEKTLRDGIVKEFTYMGLRQNGGVWSANQVEAKVRGQAGSTLLIVERGSTKANLTAEDFSLAKITRFQDH